MNITSESECRVTFVTERYTSRSLSVMVDLLQWHRVTAGAECYYSRCSPERNIDCHERLSQNMGCEQTPRGLCELSRSATHALPLCLNNSDCNTVKVIQDFIVIQHRLTCSVFSKRPGVFELCVSVSLLRRIHKCYREQLFLFRIS